MKNMGNPFKHSFTRIIERNYFNIMFLMMLVSFTLVFNNIADISRVITRNDVLRSNVLLPAVPLMVFSFGSIILYFTSFVIISNKELTLILKCLFISALVYLVVQFLVKQDWLSILKSTFIPSLKFDRNFLITLIAVLLTTLSPYLFFKQASK